MDEDEGDKERVEKQQESDNGTSFRNVFNL
jgi:hypothetical protein